MVPTFVFDWPTGEEKGDFLALDLGDSMYLFLLIVDLIFKSIESQVEQICEFA
jgi:hexokinase